MAAEDKRNWPSIRVSSVFQVKMYECVCIYVCLFVFSLFVGSLIHSITKISNKVLATLAGMCVQVWNAVLQFQGGTFFHVSYNIRLRW